MAYFMKQNNENIVQLLKTLTRTRPRRSLQDISVLLLKNITVIET